jgi:NADH-quinone oxidoreductase subunit L
MSKTLRGVDDVVVDGSVIGAAALVTRFSDGLRGLQTGFARTYALSMLAGTALIAGAVLITAMWR